MKVVDDEPGDSEIALGWRRAISETRAVLRQASAAWSRHSCPGTAECCQITVTGRPPWLWPSEWKLIVADLKRAQRPMPPARGDGGCPFLDPTGKRCTIYESRPFGCRTYFCHRIQGPARQPADETNGLLERIRDLNVAVDAEATPRAILDWARDEPR